MVKTTYEVYGFRHDDHIKRVYMLVDIDETSAGEFSTARKIAGDEYCFVTSMEVAVSVPDDAKHVLFGSKQEYYERVPQLRPQPPRQRRRRPNAFEEALMNSRTLSPEAYARIGTGLDVDTLHGQDSGDGRLTKSILDK
jgi:hypothetical protein